MLNQLILGSIQGMFEWLPVSSEGLLVLTSIHFFNQGQALKDIAREALFLHFGTFLAALVYFRKDIVKLFKCLFHYKTDKTETKNILQFLILTSFITGAIGLLSLRFIDSIEKQINVTGKVVTVSIGLLLLGTGWIQIKTKRNGRRTMKDLKITDGIFLGLVQGLATLPGFSRSGLTISVLLLRKFNDHLALKLSFLMSLPVVFIGNIVLNLGYFSPNSGLLLGLLTSFVFGLATIHFLLSLARKINFGYFVLLFGLLTIISTLI